MTMIICKKDGLKGDQRASEILLCEYRTSRDISETVSDCSRNIEEDERHYHLPPRKVDRFPEICVGKSIK